MKFPGHEGNIENTLVIQGDTLGHGKTYIEEKEKKNSIVKFVSSFSSFQDKKETEKIT